MVKIKKVTPPTTFVDISAMHGHFVKTFYTPVKQQNMHFITKFRLNISENDKIMLYQPRQPPFLSVPSVVFTGSLLQGGSKKEPVCW